ncbi:ATP-binding protein [Sphingomonas panni]|uniref:ATP-binding protein n=1 Tax=Sphingomonas panni TaxID=237612 RepID=UPI001F5B681C|nr:ATP-binding protein [Sphingomonas panni]
MSNVTSRPPQFTVVIMGRLLNNLGINMYGSLGKCLVEFAANAYDGDATTLDIDLDVDGIQRARQEVRAAAKKHHADELRALTERRAEEERIAAEAGAVLPPEAEKPVMSFVEDPLPDLTVVIRDNGHGMLPDEVQNKFLPINRDRRSDHNANGLRTEAGKRYVMGRKGIGKLSGFGAALNMSVRTKRKGETFATTFDLRQDDLLNAADLNKVPIDAVYEEGLPLEDSGTTITLSGLKCDSMKFSKEQLEDALANAFYPVRPSQFAIRINGDPIARRTGDVVYVWPEHLARKEDGPILNALAEDGPDEAAEFDDDEAAVGDPSTEPSPDVVLPGRVDDVEPMAEDEVGDDDIGRLKFRYVVKFKSKSLEAAKRGARIYCNNRLAFGPSLLDMKTGMHNFMAHQYMECIIEADELDRQNVDLISTDRGDLLRDNELVDAFVKRVTELMEQAIKDNGGVKEKKAGEFIKNAPEMEEIRRRLKQLPATQRAAGRKVMKVMIARYGGPSEEFQLVAPLVMESMGAGEVLVNLVEIARSPKDMEQVLRELQALRKVEEGDALKIYRGRRNGIVAVDKLTREGEENWRSGPRNEARLHQLLKDNPWIIHPELSSYVNSDDDFDKVLKALSVELRIDASAKPATDEEKERDATRPDLVFVLGDGRSRPDTVLIVELKSTDIPLDIAHLEQLRRYMRKVDEWLRMEFTGRGYEPRVRGVLIGAMPATNTTAEGSKDLLSRIREDGPGAAWEVIGLRDLVSRSEAIHKEMIGALLQHEKANPPEVEDEDDADDDDVIGLEDAAE